MRKLAFREKRLLSVGGIIVMLVLVFFYLVQHFTDAQADIQTEINALLSGRTTDVLVEETSDGRARGRNRNDKLVYVEGAGDRTGEVLAVKIDRTGPWSLGGCAVTAA